MKPTRRMDRPLPWRIGDLLAVYGMNIAAAIIVLLGWWGASGTGQLSTQIAWMNLAVGGLILGGIGNAVWLMTGRRSVGERQRYLLSEELSATVTGEASTSPPEGALVAAPGTTRFHRPGCPLVAGKRTRRATRSAHERAGRRSCGVCDS